MKVQGLIDQLKKYPSKTEVVIYDMEYCCHRPNFQIERTVPVIEQDVFRNYADKERFEGDVKEVVQLIPYDNYKGFIYE